MTPPRGPFDELLGTRGYDVELAIIRAGIRGIAVARSSRGRVLVTVVGPEVEPEALADRPGWDLPLLAVETVETVGGPRTAIVEALPSGIPSTVADVGESALAAAAGRGVAAEDGSPDFVLELADRISATHDAGSTVGYLQPELVLVDPTSQRLAGVAQRPVRADAAAGPINGAPRFFGAAYLTPSELRGRPPTPPDDVFRMAAFVWRWRHGADPFDGSLPDRLARTLAGTPNDGGRRDDVDDLLLRAVDADPAARPSARELLAALEGLGGRMLRPA